MAEMFNLKLHQIKNGFDKHCSCETTISLRKQARNPQFAPNLGLVM